MNILDSQFENLVSKVSQSYLTSINHSILHTKRVFKNAMKISSGNPCVDITIVQYASLLHDIARHKEDLDTSGTIDHAILGSLMAKDFLEESGFEKDFIDHVVSCIRSHRFRSNDPPQTLEAKILFDADKIDALGVVGIARCFMTSGAYHQEIKSEMDIEEYKENNITENGRIRDMSKHTPLFEWELKIKKLVDRLLTEKGKEIGMKKFEYMKEFFEKLKKES